MQPGLDRVQLQFRDQAFQSQEHPAIDRRLGRRCLLISDEATAEAAEVKELIPVGAVACQPRDIIGEDDPDIPRVTRLTKLGESGATRELLPVSGPGRESMTSIAEASGQPQAHRLLPEVILEPQALLMVDDLLWGLDWRM